MKKLLYILPAMLLLLSCESENIKENGNRKHMTFSAACARGDEGPAVRSSLSGSNVLWQENDRISIFDGVANNCFTLDEGDGSAYATFSGEAETASQYFALYPYQSSATLSSGVISATIPASQTATADTYDPTSFLSASVTGDNKEFTFHNACALLKFTADADYTSAVFTGKNGEYLAGDVLITATDSDPYVSLADGTDPSASVSLTGTISDGENYFAAIRPQNLEAGLGIELTDADGNIYRQSWSAKNVLRNKSYNLGTLSPEQIFLECDFSGPEISMQGYAATFNIYAKSFTSSDLHSLSIDYSTDGGNTWNPSPETMLSGNFDPTFEADDAKTYNGTIDLTFLSVSAYKVRMTATAGAKSISKTVDINVISPISTTYYRQNGSVVTDPSSVDSTRFQASWTGNQPDFKIAFCDANGNAIDWEKGDVLEAKITACSGYPFTFGDTDHTTSDGIICGYSNGAEWWRIEVRKNGGSTNLNVTTHAYPYYIRISKTGGLEYGYNGTDYYTGISPDDAKISSLFARGTTTPFYYGSYYSGSTPTYEYLRVTRDRTITPDIPIQSISVTPSTATVTAGMTLNTLSASALPAAASQSVTWSSSNTAVATVNPTTGVVTGVAPGTCDIIATSNKDNTKSGSCALTVEAAHVTGVTVTPATATVTAGRTLSTLSAIVSPSVVDQNVTWSSSDPTVATVNPATGVVTAVAAGTCDIIATSSADNTKSGSCALTVAPAVTGVTVSPATASLTVTGTTTLSASVQPSDAIQTVTWSSSDPTVATVNASTGVVTAVGPGSCNIIAKSTDDTSKQGTCAVTVSYAAPTGLSVNPATASVQTGGTTTITATVAPAGANQAVTWASSNTAVATVDSSTGVVTGVAGGSCNIIATSVADGTLTASCVLTVVDGPDEVMLWENFTSTASGFSKVLTVVTSGTPGDSQIDFSHGDYIELKFTAPSSVVGTGGMMFHIGDVSPAGNPWNMVQAIYVTMNNNNPTWTNLVYRAENKNGPSKNTGVGPVYVRLGYQGKCWISNDGTSWSNSAAFDTEWTDHIITKSSITVGNCMLSGSANYSYVAGVNYEYIKIVRGN